MALNIKNSRVEQLAGEIAARTGETKTAAILRALEERKQRLAVHASSGRRLADLLDFLEREIWPHIPRPPRRLSKAQRERILGYRDGGV
jgi:antitoxin VapB